MTNVVLALTDLVSVSAFSENARPILIDAGVGFADSDFAGGILLVTGMLPEDRVGLAVDASVSLEGTTAMVGGIAVGAVAGGVGAPFTITLNTSANAATVETLIEHLTCRTVSETPNANRTLSISVTNATGEFTQDLPQSGFATTPDAVNPFAGIDVGAYSTPALGDLDGDGDIDPVVGNEDGPLRIYLHGPYGTYIEKILMAILAA